MAAYSHVSSIQFGASEVGTDTLDFTSITTSKIKAIGFDCFSSSHVKENAWASKSQQHLNDFIAAVSKSKIKHSLTEVYINECDIDQVEAMKILTKHGFPSIKVIESFISWKT